MNFKNALTRLIATCAIILFLGIEIIGQTRTNYQIKGVVADSVTHNLLPLITVRLKNANHEVIQIIVTSQDGSFKFPEVIPGSFWISVEASGYKIKTLPVEAIRFNVQNIDVGLIYMEEVALGLKEVEITAERPVLTRKADRIVYDLKADPESKSNNVLTMMRKIPYLSVDGDDNLMMKGNSNFKVLINGKASGSMEGNLKAVLKSIPASTIERIEVITTPPSRYDAEGLAGIINIITSKKTNDGFNGAVNVNESFPVGGPGIGGTFTAKRGRFGISAFGGGNTYRLPETFNTNSRVDANGTKLEQEGNQRSTNNTRYFGTELSYLIDTLHLLTAQFNYNGSNIKDHSAQGSSLIGLNELLQQYRLENVNKSSGYGIDAGINYEIGFKEKKNRLLTFSYLFGTNLNDKNGNIAFGNRVNFTNPDFQQTNHQLFKEHTFQADFVTPVKNMNIEAGLKGILRKNGSDFEYNAFNPDLGIYEKDPGLSNSFNNIQNVFSIYNSYQLNLNSWNINAGLRLEATVIRADFFSTATIADQNYFNVIPALAISKRFNEGSSINVGYSQRIRRPGINRLNPYVDRSNPNYEIAGNPELRPVLLNDIQLGYGINKKLAVNIGLNYSFMDNLDLQVVNFNTAAQVTRITYANTGKSSNLGANLYLSYPLSSRYTVSMNGNIMQIRLSGEDNGLPITNDLLLYMLTYSNVVRLNKGWALNADLGLNSRNPTGLQGYSNGFLYTAFNINKDIIKNKFSIGGGIKNPFTKYRNHISKTFGPQFSQIYESRNYFRSFQISLNYNFGGLNSRIQKSRTEIKNNDMSR